MGMLCDSGDMVVDGKNGRNKFILGVVTSTAYRFNMKRQKNHRGFRVSMYYQMRKDLKYGYISNY